MGLIDKTKLMRVFDFIRNKEQLWQRILRCSRSNGFGP